MTDDDLERGLADLDPARDIERAPSEELLAQTLARPRASAVRRAEPARSPWWRRRPLLAALAAITIVATPAAAATGVAIVRGGSQPAFSDPRPNVPSCDRGPVNRSGACPRSASFTIDAFLGRGDWADCVGFARQADAQAVLRADPSDPNQLDIDRDGIACPGLTTGPLDVVPVPRAAATGAAR